MLIQPITIIQQVSTLKPIVIFQGKKGPPGPPGPMGDEGMNENKYTYSYLADGSVDTITEKDQTDTIISTTTFTYLASSGDVDTSVKVMNGQTVTTQYVYDINENLIETINTLS